MATGTVQWFNHAKGFGIVTTEVGKQDLFAHYSEINMDGLKRLKEGQRITFDITQGARGYQASNIREA